MTPSSLNIPQAGVPQVGGMTPTPVVSTAPEPARVSMPGFSVVTESPLSLGQWELLRAYVDVLRPPCVNIAQPMICDPCEEVRLERDKLVEELARLRHENRDLTNRHMAALGYVERCIKKGRPSPHVLMLSKVLTGHVKGSPPA